LLVVRTMHLHLPLVHHAPAVVLRRVLLLFLRPAPSPPWPLQQVYMEQARPRAVAAVAPKMVSLTEVVAVAVTPPTRRTTTTHRRRARARTLLLVLLPEVPEDEAAPSPNPEQSRTLLVSMAQPIRQPLRRPCRLLLPLPLPRLLPPPPPPPPPFPLPPPPPPPPRLQQHHLQRPSLPSER